MRSFNLAAAVLAACSVLAGPAFAQSPEEQPPQDDPGGFRVFWRNGLHMETNDGRFQVRLGGRIQYDWTGWGDDADVEDHVAGPIQDGTEFRRARLFVRGYVYEHVEYKSQFDFAGGEVAIKDLYFGIQHPKYGLRVGHMKEPFSIEELTSSKYITFLERSLVSIFDSERNSGFLLHGNLVNGRMHYGIGFFRETGDDGIGAEAGRYALTGRIADRVIDGDDGRKLLLVGAGLTWRNVENGMELEFSQRPEANLAPEFISTGKVPTNSVTILSLEAAGVHGPLSVQSEWKQARITSPETGNPIFWGGYAYASYFLTGEHRVYSNGVAQRLIPNRNLLDGAGGKGAWEVAVRYSVLDLFDEGVPAATLTTGSRLDDITLALNWYWNPMTLMKLNLIRADIRDVGDSWAILWRGQIEF